MHLNRGSLATFASGFLLLLVNSVEASSISRNAVSGQPKRIAAYHSWDPATCTSLSAKLNVLSKPAHGTLIPRVVPHTITTSRYGSVGHCAGKPIKALQIEYKSVPGFRGTDNFTIDVVFGWEGRRDTDSYSITVE